MRLYAITGGGGRIAERVEEALAAGADQVVVREPELPAGLHSGRCILHVGMAGVAALLDAGTLPAGLHLPARESVRDWRRRWPGLLGASAHDPTEAAEKRAAGADYVFLSPIFEARHGRPALGTRDLAGCVALGGVTPERVAPCRDAGAAGVAVLGGIWHAPDGIPAAIARYLATLAQYDHTTGS